MKITAYMALTRARVSAFAALSALTGYLSGDGRMDSGAAIALFGTFFLASGASALNQVAERRTDALMKRTMKRPIPSGDTGAMRALLLSIVLIAAGLAVLATGSPGAMATILAVTALLVYNGLYTPLKRISGLAILVGAIAGAMPPAIGWAISGEGTGSPLLIAICLLFYLWQMPHFWMLLSRYRVDYERAGLATIMSRMSEAQVRRIGLTWTVATSSAGLMLPLFGLEGSGVTAMVLMLSATAILFLSGILEAFSVNQRPSFASSNIYILLIMLSLVSGKAGI